VFACQPALAQRYEVIIYGLLGFSRIEYQTLNLQFQVYARGLGQGFHDTGYWIIEKERKEFSASLWFLIQDLACNIHHCEASSIIGLPVPRWNRGTGREGKTLLVIGTSP